MWSRHFSKQILRFSKTSMQVCLSNYRIIADLKVPICTLWKAVCYCVDTANTINIESLIISLWLLLHIRHVNSWMKEPHHLVRDNADFPLHSLLWLKYLSIFVFTSYFDLWLAFLSRWAASYSKISNKFERYLICCKTETSVSGLLFPYFQGYSHFSDLRVSFFYESCVFEKPFKKI